MHPTAVEVPEAPDLYVEIGRKVVNEPQQRKNTVRQDVRNDLHKKYGDEIDRFGIPYITTRGTTSRFFLQTARRDFKGCPTTLMRAFETTKEVFAPVFRRAREIGRFGYSQVQDMLNLTAGPGEYVRATFHVSEKGAALDKPEVRRYIGDFVRAKPSPIFSVKGKYEMLEAVKCPTGEVRTFEIAPVEYLIPAMRNFQSMVEALLEGHPLSAYGIVLQHGGFTSVMDEFEPDATQVCYAGDVAKWDKNNCGELMYLSYELLRELCEDNESHETLDWMIETEMYSVLLLPDGRLVQKIGPALFNSGTFATTAMNILKHVLIYIYRLYLFKQRGLLKGVNAQISLFQLFKGEKFKCYADDHIGKGDPRLNAFTTRREAYDHFGMSLKLEEDFVSKTTEGVKFLGFNSVKRMPIFSRDKILTGLWLLREENGEIADQSQMLAMVVLAAMDGKDYHGKPFNQVVWDVANKYFKTHYDGKELERNLGDSFSGGSLRPVEFFAQLWTHKQDLPKSLKEMGVSFFLTQILRREDRRKPKISRCPPCREKFVF